MPAGYLHRLGTTLDGCFLMPTTLPASSPPDGFCAGWAPSHARHLPSQQPTGWVLCRLGTSAAHPPPHHIVSQPPAGHHGWIPSPCPPPPQPASRRNDYHFRASSPPDRSDLTRCGPEARRISTHCGISTPAAQESPRLVLITHGWAGFRVEVCVIVVKV